MAEIGWVWSLLALIPLSLLAVALWFQYRSGQCCANATIVVPCCCCGLESGRQRSGRGGGGAGSAWLASFLTIYACAWLGLMLGLHSSSAEGRGGQRLQQQPERLGGPGSAPGPSGAAGGGGASGPAEPPPAESLNALFYGIRMEPPAYQPIRS